MAFGLTVDGFIPKQQQDIISEVQSSLQLAFGQNINLLPESVFGQIVGIFSEREALLWQLSEAVYASQYPAGAEGTSVDNILALNNLKRLGARPTVTSPEEDGVPGLVFLGTPGTIIPAGSLISVPDQANSQFSTDTAVTIAAAVNAIEAIYFSNVPDTGGFTLKIEDALGNLLTTEALSYLTLSDETVVLFSSVPSTGSFELVLTQSGVAETTAAIPYTDNAAGVQAKIQALTGYSSVTVAGDFTSGFTVTWGSISQPLVTVAANTLAVTVTPYDSLQAAINCLHEAAGTSNHYPYSDVVVSGNFTTGFMVSFGAGTPTTGNSNSGSLPQNLFTVPTNTMQQGSTVTNINVVMNTTGSPAQATGSATAVVSGPLFAPAGTITQIDSPISGWSSVTNPLDALTGANIETDTESLNRRAELLAANANGPLQSIVQKVSEVAFVTAVVGFENVGMAALQLISFSDLPSSGAFVLDVSGEVTASIPYTADQAAVQAAINALPGLEDVLVTGNFLSGFTIDFNGAGGGQAQPLTTVVSNTLDGGLVDVTPSFGRDGKSFEVVVEGGNNESIAESIYGSKPAGIKAYGDIQVTTTDAFGNPTVIGFSRPTEISFYVIVSMVTDLLINGNPNPKAKFNPESVATIQQEISAIGNSVAIGSLVVGFGSDGLIGAFNNVPGIVSYTLYFDRLPAPSTNTNVQLQPKERASFESFNIQVSYT
jgi:hypothetical protein